MNSTARTATTSATQASLPAFSGGFYQRLTLRALAQMPSGQLHLELPDGTVHRLGGKQHAQWHATTLAPAALVIPQAAAIKIRRPAFFEKCVLHGDIGFAEAFIDGDWETPDLAAVIAWFVLNVDRSPSLSGSRAKALGVNLLHIANRLNHLLRPNTRRTAALNIHEHYDLSNDFFRLWLDPSMMYSSARWERPEFTLEQAQYAKNEALCRKLRLTAADHVLEIGTGWGGWSLHAAKNYGCRVTSITIAQEQYDFARQRIAAAGLADRIEVRLQDYRDIPAGEQFDKLVSIEMLEAVGHRYLEGWCRVVTRALKPDGLMALQFITCADNRYDEIRRGVDFIQKHVFPGSLLLSVNRINDLLAKTGGFVLHALDDMSQDYARTLRVWRETFNQHAVEVHSLGFDERFLRKWNYYLAYCEAAFAMRNISVVQTVHTRPNNLSFN